MKFLVLPQVPNMAMQAPELVGIGLRGVGFRVQGLGFRVRARIQQSRVLTVDNFEALNPVH